MSSYLAVIAFFRLLIDIDVDTRNSCKRDSIANRVSRARRIQNSKNEAKNDDVHCRENLRVDNDIRLERADENSVIRFELDLLFDCDRLEVFPDSSTFVDAILVIELVSILCFTQMRMLDATFVHRVKFLFAVRVEFDENHDKVFDQIDENFISVCCHDHEDLNRSSICIDVHELIYHEIETHFRILLVLRDVVRLMILLAEVVVLRTKIFVKLINIKVFK